MNFYQFAYQYLVAAAHKNNNNVTEEIVDLYLKSSDVKTLNDVFRHLLISAQNRSMLINVIGGQLKIKENGVIKADGVESLSRILFEFNPKDVLQKYKNNESTLLNDIKSTFPELKINENNDHNLWRQYCKAIVSSALFLSQFNNLEDFKQWVDPFYKDKSSIAALPRLISSKVYGIGFVLACNFLKELGYMDYGKPDVHIKDILKAYGHIDDNSSDCDILKKMTEIAKDCGVSCYALDKVLWLIGSGKFYKINDPKWDKFYELNYPRKNKEEVKKTVSIGSMKDDFISKVQEFKKVSQNVL